MHILVTGGAGYIGSHTCVELLNAGHQVSVIDSFANSSENVFSRIKEITKKSVSFYRVNLLNIESIRGVFEKNNFDAVIHFAGLKAVGESVQKPLLYYRTNIDSTLNLLEVMKEYGVKRFVFSSSATVYGVPSEPKIKETFPTQSPSSPYGKTKLMIEEILQDILRSDKTFSIALLRYFNPIGAHESGLIGEDPKGIPNNLMPFIAQVATGKREQLSIFGNDYDTPDGTGVRDYIHVVDLALGHIAALNKLMSSSDTILVYNLGSSHGTSVLELVRAFEKASGKTIPFVYAPRREGDIDEYYADATKAKAELGWQTTKTITDMCQDTWKWQSKNPNGYE